MYAQILKANKPKDSSFNKFFMICLLIKIRVNISKRAMNYDKRSRSVLIEIDCSQLQGQNSGHLYFHEYLDIFEFLSL